MLCDPLQKDSVQMGPLVKVQNVYEIPQIPIDPPFKYLMEAHRGEKAHYV